MPITWKKLLRCVVPPAWSGAYLNRFRAVRYVGNYATWQDAQAHARGYDAANILAQVATAARKARDGSAAFERDGVAFAEPAYNWPLLACLLREAHKHGGVLRVLDFGGSLGSIYFQHRWWLRDFETRWAVVEQPGFVDLGRREFTTDVLTFHSEIADAVRAIEPTVALFSGVLAWIAEPRLPIDQVMAARVPAILIDRTPLTSRDHDVVKVQHVPPSIYKASYPCWFLSRARFMAVLERDYQLEAELPQHDPQVEGTVFAGLYFTIRP
jgi:putative methyltransferase (TIGR04325 family)